MKDPEAQFIVEVTADDEITCRAPERAEQRIRMSDIASVYVETNDSGPWGVDVWWILNDCTGQARVAFPQLATGEDAALDGLRQLPGFEVRGDELGRERPLHVLADARDLSVCLGVVCCQAAFDPLALQLHRCGVGS